MHDDPKKLLILSGVGAHLLGSYLDQRKPKVHHSVHELSSWLHTLARRWLTIS